MYHVFMKMFSGNLKQGSQSSATRWDFLTNHAHVLVCVAHESGIRLRDIAAAGYGAREQRAEWVLELLLPMESAGGPDSI